MAESEYARNMRRQTEQQTEYAHETLQEAAKQTQLALEQSRYAAQLAVQQATDAAEQYAIQVEMADSLRSHNFAMWRETTPNGQEYASWSRQAKPLVLEFDRRWGAWQAAIKKDTARVNQERTARSEGLFNLDAPKFRSVLDREVSSLPDTLRRLGWALIGAVVLSPVLAIVGLIANSIWSIPFLSADYSVALVMLHIPATLFVAFSLRELFVQHPRTRQFFNKSQDAEEWVQTEVGTFANAMPKNWSDPGGHDTWNSLVAAKTAINSMPYNYVDFHESMLVNLSGHLPMPLNVNALPGEATATRALLTAWSGGTSNDAQQSDQRGKTHA